MKKVLFLIPLFVFSMMANAKSVTITPTSPYYSHSNLQLALNAMRAEKIDTILLSEGTYVESNNYLVADTNIVIMASESASSAPIVQVVTYVQIKNNANVKIKGIKFDGSAQNSYDYFIRFYDNSHSSLVLNDCEFYNVKQIVIQGKSDSHTDSLIVNNCFFHNNKKQAIYFKASSTEGRQTCDSLAVTNSTFAHTDALTDWISIIDVSPYGSSMTNAIKVLIDHCTFYNNPTVDSGHADIRLYKLSSAIVSNCIFAHPEPYDRRATYNYGGTISNCLTYNLTKDREKYGHRQDGGQPVLTDDMNGNPVFRDPENNDFTLLNASSARRLGTVYGDPRWFNAISTNAIPATLQPKDALLSDSASIISGTADSINLKYEGNRKFNEAEWAKWHVNVSKDGLYNFTAHTYRTSSQKYEIKLLNNDESLILKENTNTSMSSGAQTISTGNVSLEAGHTYVVKVRNLYANADGVLLKVVASYEGGAIVAVPDTLWPVDAMRSERAFVNESGELRFTDDGHSGYIHDQWAKWKISVPNTGKYKFTANVNSDNNQNYRITIKNSTESSTINTSYGPSNSSGARKVSTELIDLTAGDYVVMIEDTVKYSHGRVINMIATYEGGAVVNIPGQILCEEAVICQNGTHTPKMYHLENGDLKYNANGYNLEEYAYWNLNVTEAGEMAVTLNIATSGHTFGVALYQGNTRLDSIGETETTMWDGGNITLPNTLTFPATGSYVLRIFNHQQHSGGALHGITFAPYVAPAGVVMTDTDTDNSAWVNHVDETADVQLNRTILGGMYNTICLPFKVSSTQCKAIFGNDVELYTLGSATISGDILNLQFNTASDIWNGTPILIKTSSDIVNPVFEGVTIESKTGDHTDGGAVVFRSTFVQKEFHNGDQVLLLVANNMLAYPLSDRTLKGFRAYFEVKDTPSGAPIRGARIIAGEHVVTNIDLVDMQEDGMDKVIENGQLFIIRDGVRYNALGVEVK